MPFPKPSLVVACCLTAGLAPAGAWLVGVTLAWGDHGVPAPDRGGLGWTSWLLIAGAVVAVSLAAWAFFAPDRGDRSPDGPGQPRGRPDD